ncbi:tape measure protein [Fructobacillus tropaeoli]|uniref:tape measure protein n=1 Tax=Fructobacillus tropaeoli TaxID=709323 RepID=UPI0030C8B2BD
MFSGPLDKVKRGLQETSEQPKKFTASLMDIAKGAGAFAVISKGLDVVKDSIGSAVGRFDTLNAYPKVMKQMGYSTQDTQESVKLLKKGIDGLPTSLQDITKNAQSFAILTGSAKTGAQTANALNDAFLASGASAADASRGVQQYSQMLAAGKVDMQSWRTLTETMPYALNEVAKAFGFTGKSAQKDLYDALQNGTITTDQLNKKFIELDGGVNGFANTARTATGGIGTSFTNMRNAVVNGLANTITAIDNGIKSAGIKGGIAELFNDAKNIINDGFQKINSVVETYIPQIISVTSGLFKFIDDNKDWMLPLTAGIASATAAYKAYIIAANLVALTGNISKELSIIAFAFSNVRKEAGTAKAAMVAFNVATGGNLIGAGILALQAIIVALTLFFTKTETGRKAWEKLSETVSKVTGKIASEMEKIASAVAPIFSKMASVTTSAFSAIDSFAKKSFDSVKNSISKTLSNAGTSMGTVMDSMKNSAQSSGSSIANSFNQMKNNVGNAFDSIRQSSSGVFEKIGEAIGKVVIYLTPAIESLTNFLSTAQGFRVVASIFVGIATSIAGISLPISLLIGLLTKLGIAFAQTGNFSQAVDIVSNDMVSMVDNATVYFSKFSDIIVNVINSIADYISGHIDQITDVMVNIITKMAEVVSNNLPILITKFTDVITKLITSLSEKIPDVVNAIVPMIPKIVDAISQSIPQLLMAGVQIILSILNGIVSALPQIINAIIPAINSLVQAFTQMLPQLIEVGVKIIITLIEGLVVAIPLLLQALVPLIMQITQALIQNLPIIIQAIVQIIIAISMALIQNLPIIIQAIVQIAIALVQAVVQILPLLIQAVIQIVIALAGALIQNLPTILMAIVQIGIAIVKGVLQIAGALVVAAVQLVWALIKGLLSMIGALGGAVANLAMSIINGIGSFVGNIFNSGVNLIKSFINGLISLIGNVGRVGKDILDNIVNAIKKPHLLIDAGKAIIDGFVDGLKSAWEAGMKFIGGIGKWIKEHKGPISYDARLLIPAGNAIMDGLNKGLQESYKGVQSNVAGMADDLQTQFSGQLNANATQTSRNVSQIEVTANNSTNGLLREVVNAIREGQIITINGNQMIGATASGYDGALGDIMTDRRRNQL